MTLIRSLLTLTESRMPVVQTFRCIYKKKDKKKKHFTWIGKNKIRQGACACPRTRNTHVSNEINKTIRLKTYSTQQPHGFDTDRNTRFGRQGERACAERESMCREREHVHARAQRTHTYRTKISK